LLTTPKPVEILLAEDDQDLRDATLAVLEQGGYSAAGVPNGLEALEWLAHASPPPSLILLDQRMPVMDGPAFREEQLKSPALASIPVAILSAKADAAVDAGVLHLRKPVRPRELLAFVARFCVRPEEAR